MEYYRNTLYIYTYICMNETHQKLLKGGRRLRKSNIDGVNLIKVHYMHIVSITMKPFVQLIYINKN
jgi:hypothetical protein